MSMTQIRSVEPRGPGHRVGVPVGQAPPVSAAPAHDKLDVLLAIGQQFDNIIIK